MIKKAISLLVSVAMLTAVLSGCTSATTTEDNKISVVCTIFPQYDWARQIIGENNNNVELTLLLDNGIDLHNYQPTAEDIITISECDVFIYVGGASDGWVDEILASAKNTDIRVIDMIEVIGEDVREEELVEGMEGENHDHEHDDDHDKEHEHEHDEEPEYDEHIWLSLKNAKKICSSITDALCAVDAENSAAYKANSQSYVSELDALDKEYETMVSSAARNTILVADRFPFRYLVDDYGIEYYAAFVGCSAETEASFETVVFLSGKVDELSLPVVFAIDGSDMSIAKTVVSNTEDKNQKILTLNSLQSVTLSDIEKDISYVTVMRENYQSMKEALN